MRYERSRAVKQCFLVLAKPQKHFQAEPAAHQEPGLSLDAALWYRGGGRVLSGQRPCQLMPQIAQIIRNYVLTVAVGRHLNDFTTGEAASVIKLLHNFFFLFLFLCTCSFPLFLMQHGVMFINVKALGKTVLSAM